MSPTMRPCPSCDGDGYTETWNDDQSGVVIEPCESCAATGFEGAGFVPEDFMEAVSREAAQ